MIFGPTKFSDAFTVQLQPHEDSRGAFARTYCADAFRQRGVTKPIVQSNISTNKVKGTLRGLHMQAAPRAEAKLVSCIAGSIFDVIVDMRPDSTTFRQWQSFELSSKNLLGLFIPEGFAHGFQTLTDDSTVLYNMFENYAPEHGIGYRWDDPKLSISWPIAQPILSPKDSNYSYLE